MKRGLVVLIALVALAGCNPSQQQLWQKDKATGFGGLVRHIRVIDEITGNVVYDKTGRCFVADGSTPGDVKILWIDGNKKDDIIGSHFLLIAEEVQQ